MTYPVNEIFYSLQGEGFHTGKPAVFVRMSGCNLQCTFCDTDFTSSTNMRVEEIVEKVGEYKCPTVVITGGEPSLYDLNPLTFVLHGKGMRVHVETNGTNDISAPVDWITCSPKLRKSSGEAGLCLHPSMYVKADEVKVVNNGSILSFLPILEAKFTTGNLFLQPCSGTNITETVEYVLSHPWWRLSLQTHKLINIP